MPIQKPSQLFQRGFLPSVLRVFVVLAVLAMLVPVYTYTRGRLQPTPVSAAAGINHQINFQGKLTNPDGTNVTDGSYSIVFSIYTVASGGTNVWTETQSVTLSNGIFQVMLGSVTTLPGSVDFNTDNIYLGIKVGADAEMSPRVRFGAVPQAFNAEKLGGLDKTGFIQNSTSMQSAANLYIQSGAIGNVTAKLRAFTGQTADILQVRDSGDTTTVFAISPAGAITAGTWNGTAITDAFVSDTLTVGSAGTVDWQALNNYPAACSAGNAITTLGDTVTCSPFLTAEADTLASVTGRGATTATAVTFSGGATIRGVTVDSATGTNDKIAMSITTVGAASFTGTITNSDLTAARTWTMQDNSGVVALGTAANALFFTTTGATNVTLPTSGTLCSTATCVTAEADTLSTVTGRGATTATASSFTGGATIRGLTVDTATATQDRILVTAAAVGAARFDGSLTNSDLTAARTWTLQDNSGVVALGTAANSLFFTTTGATNVTLPTSGTLCSTATCVTAEADTLASVTGRGSSTATASTFTGGATIRSLTVDTATATQDRILVTAAAVGAARFDGSITNADLTAARTWTFPDATGTICLSTGNCANGVTTVGTFSASSQTNGANITGATITFGPADTTNPGMVTASGSQTFGGTKIFNGLIQGNAGITVSGGAVSLTGNAASSLTTSSGALTITSATAATWSTTAGDLTIQAGSGWVSLGTSSVLTANGQITLMSGGTSNLVADTTGTTAALLLGTTNANAVSIGRSTKLTGIQGSLSVAEGANILNSATIQGTLNVYTATATDDRILTAVTAGGAARFDGTITNKDLTAARAYSLQDASGVLALGTAANSLFFTTTGATNVTLPTSGTLCSTTSCATAGSGYVQFAPASVQTDTTTNSSIFINKTGASGNILQLQNGGTDVFTINNSGSVTVGAGKSLTITGSGTRPGSPTAGMLYYDTTTNQLLQWNGSKWVSDHTIATKIIAPSNASQTAKDAADVVLTGTADQTLINTALTAAAGGKVYIMEGTVNVTGSISVPNNTTLAGAGRGTLITIPNATNLAINMITNTTTGGSGTGVVIQDMQLDGNRPNNLTATTYGVYLNGIGSGTTTQGAKVNGMWINNFHGGAVFLTSSSNNIITNNTTINNYDRGFSITSGSNNVISNNISQTTPYGYYIDTATNNTLSGNSASGSVNDGFRITNNSNYNTISGNTSDNGGANNFIVMNTSTANTFTGNTASNGGTDGFALVADGNTFTGNTAYSNNSAQFDVIGSYNTFTGNTLKGTSSSFYGFQLTSANNNTISGNTIIDQGSTTTNNAFRLSSADFNNITGNNINDSSHTSTNYAIDIISSSSDSNYLSNNTLNGASIHDLGTGTIYGGQVDSTGVYEIQPSNGTLIQASSTATTTLSVQTAAGANLIQVSTATNGNLITNPSLEFNTTGWNARTGTTLTRTTTATNYYYGIAAAQGVNTATANAGINYPIVLSPNTTYTISVMLKMTVVGLVSFGYSADGATEATYVNASANANGSAGAWQQSCLSFTTPATVNAGAYIFLKQNDSNARTMYLDGLRAESGVAACSIGGGGARYQENQINLGPAGTSVLIGASDSNIPTNLNSALFVQQNRGSKGLVVRGTPENDFSPPIFEVQNSAGTQLLGVNNLTDNVQIYGGSSFYGTPALMVRPVSASVVGLRVIGAVSQTGNLFEGTNNSGTDVFTVGAAGDLKVGAAGIMPTITTSVRSTSSGAFAAKADYTTPSSSFAVTNADFNGDGKMDIATTATVGATTTTLSIFMNNGNGTFAAKVDYTAGVNGLGITSGDFNRDGKPDIAVTNFASNTMSVFINTGNGTFAAKVDSTTGTGPHGITSADFNGDGWPDLATANSTGATVSVFLNNGNGTFPGTASSSPGTGTTPQGITSADLNGDGKPDIAVANNGAATTSVLLNTGTGTFATKVDYGTGTSPAGITAADFNGDGKYDLGVANGASTASILINNGNGTYATKVDYTTNTTARGITAADYNGDGKMDMAVTNNAATSVSVYLNSGLGSGQFGASPPAATSKTDYTTGAGSAPQMITSADFNGDGFPDLATPSASTVLSVFLNTVTSGFSSSTSTQLTAKQSVISDSGKVGLLVQGASTTDNIFQAQNSSGQLLSSIDGSGRLTVGGGPVYVAQLSVDGHLSFAAKVDYTTGTGPQGVTSADFNGDGKPDTAITNGGTTSMSVFMNNGNGTFATKVDYTTGTAPRGVTSADFNGDGKPDIAVSNNGSTSISVFINNGDGTFATKVDYTGGSGPDGITAADFNGDGKPDIAITNSGTNFISVFINSGTGTFAAKVDYTTGTVARSITSADFNGDGASDLAVANSGSTSMSIFINSGTGTFAAKVDYTTGTGPYSITSADFNGDGKPDLAVANFTSATTSVFINNGDGTFAAKVDYTTGTGPQGITSADFNGDGKPDLAVTNGNSGAGTTMSVFTNNGDGTFASRVNYTTGAGPWGIAAADFNGDGKPDITAVNYNNGTGTTQSVFINSTNSKTNPVSKGTLSVTMADASSGGLYIQGIANQTADYLNIQNSSGTNLVEVDKDGNMTIANQLLVRGSGPSNPYALKVGSQGVVSVGVSTDGWYSGYNKTLSVRGTAGGAVCGTEGCPVITLNDGGTSGSRWGIGVNAAGTMSFMTENGTAATVRVTFSNTANLTVAGTNACTIGSGTGATSCTSDSRLKNITGTPTDNLSKIMQLQPTYYTWKSDPTATQRFGLIAQDVQQVLPEFVVTGSDGYLQLDYGGLVAPIIGAVKEQQGEITAMQDTLADINSVLESGTFDHLDIAHDVSVGGNLKVTGDVETRNITVNGHIITGGDVPQVVVGQGAGTADAQNNIAAPVVTIMGNDTSGTLTITTGANTLADELAHISFANAFGGKPRIVLTPANRQSSQISAYYDATNTANDGFSIFVNNVPTTNTTYSFTYFVVQ